MYVLHYDYSCWDEHESEVIAVSEDKAKLEGEIERLMAPVREFRDRNDAHRKAQADYQQRCQKKVRNFLEKNLECVREIRPQLFNGEYYVKDFHTLANTPYHPEVKKREQEKAIDVIVTSHWQLFVEGGDPTGKRISEFINSDLLKEPLPVIEREEHPWPKMAEGYACYNQEGFKIEEVAVL